MKIHVFPFSRRSGTPAAKMPNQVSAPVKKARCQELTRSEAELTRQFAATLVGRVVEVLVEGLSATRPGFVQGTDRRYVTVEMPGDSRDFGHLITGIARSSGGDDLVAVRLSAPHQASVFVSDCLESRPVRGGDRMGGIANPQPDTRVPVSSR